MFFGEGLRDIQTQIESSPCYCYYCYYCYCFGRSQPSSVRSVFKSSCFGFSSRPWGFELLHAYRLRKTPVYYGFAMCLDFGHGIWDPRTDVPRVEITRTDRTPARAPARQPCRRRRERDKHKPNYNTHKTKVMNKQQQTNSSKQENNVIDKRRRGRDRRRRPPRAGRAGRGPPPGS